MTRTGAAIKITGADFGRRSETVRHKTRCTSLSSSTGMSFSAFRKSRAWITSSAEISACPAVMCRSCDWFKQRRLLRARDVNSNRNNKLRLKPKSPITKPNLRIGFPCKPRMKTSRFWSPVARRTRRRPGPGNASPSRGRAHTTSGLAQAKPTSSDKGGGESEEPVNGKSRLHYRTRSGAFSIGHRALMLWGLRDTGFAATATAELLPKQRYSDD